MKITRRIILCLLGLGIILLASVIILANINISSSKNNIIIYNSKYNNLTEVQKSPLSVVNNYDELIYKCWNSENDINVNEYINYLFKVATSSFKISVGTKEKLVKNQIKTIKTEKENGVKFINSYYEDPININKNTVKINVKDSFSDGDKIIEYTLIKENNKWYIDKIFLVAD